MTFGPVKRLDDVLPELDPDFAILVGVVQGSIMGTRDLFPEVAFVNIVDAAEHIQPVMEIHLPSGVYSVTIAKVGASRVGLKESLISQLRHLRG